MAKTIGIDLGTTNSVVASSKPVNLRLFRTRKAAEQRHRWLPSRSPGSD